MPVLPQTDAHLRQPYPTAGAEPLLALVWQPKDLRPDVVTLARQAATRAVLDLTAAPPRSFATSLRDAGATEVKVWADFLLDPGLQDFLELSGVETLWRSTTLPSSPGPWKIFWSAWLLWEMNAPASR